MDIRRTRNKVAVNIQIKDQIWHALREQSMGEKNTINIESNQAPNNETEKAKEFNMRKEVRKILKSGDGEGRR